MTLKKVAALYSILTGVSMFAVWGLYFSTGKVMGVTPETMGLSFHIVAEFATGAVMITGGIGLLKSLRWGRSIYFTGIGMMVYALVNSPGYYIGKGWFIMAVFGASFVFSIVFAGIGLAMKD